MTTATKTRRGLSLLLALVLLAGMLPTAALAAEEETAEPSVTEEPAPQEEPSPAPEPEDGDTEETEPADPPETEGTGEPETPAEPEETESEATPEPESTPDLPQMENGGEEPGFEDGMTPTPAPEPSETPEVSEDPEPSESPEASKSPEPSESPDIMDFTFSATSFSPIHGGSKTGGGNVTETLIKQESGENTYDLPIPVGAVIVAGSKLTITAPEGTSSFEVKYTKYENSSTAGTETTVSASEGKIELTDYYASQNSAPSNLYFTDSIEITIGGTTSVLKLKPYIEVVDLTVRTGDKSNNQKKLGTNIFQDADGTYYLEVDSGTSLKNNKSGVFSCNGTVGQLKIEVSNLDEIQNKLKGKKIEEDVTVEFTLGDALTEQIKAKVDILYVKFEIRVKKGPPKEPQMTEEANSKFKAVERVEQNKEFVVSLKDIISNVAGTEGAPEGVQTTYAWTVNKKPVGDNNTDSLTVDTKIPRLLTVQCTVTNTVNGQKYTCSTPEKKIYIKPEEGYKFPTLSFIVQPEDAIFTRGASDENPLLTAEISKPSSEYGYEYEQKWIRCTLPQIQDGETLDYSSWSGSYTENSVSLSVVPRTDELGETYYFCEVRTVYSYMSDELSDNGVTYKYIEYTSEPTYSNPAKVTIVKKEMNLEGEGTAESPYLIETYDDLVTIRDQVNDGFPFSDTYFRLANDITLKNDWTSMGQKVGDSNGHGGPSIAPFSGTIDGDGHRLNFEGTQPLLNYARNAKLLNLKIFGNYFSENGILSNYPIDTLGSFTLELENVTILSGTKIHGSGVTGGTHGISGGSNDNIIATDCVIESGVKIGVNADGSSAGLSNIGSFFGETSGKLTNCVSSADVYGCNNVGGLWGTKAQSMSSFNIQNCQFHGNVHATGNYVGGIVGCGYVADSAPNSRGLHVTGCTVTGSVTGGSCVGGIAGGDPGIDQHWPGGMLVTGNKFTGMVYGNSNVGGIIGYVRSLNRNSVIENNYFASGGRAIGKVLHIDTSAVSFGMHDGVMYYSTELTTWNSYTEEQLNEIWNVVDSGWNSRWKKSSIDENHMNSQRDDDPLGVDADNLGYTGEFEGDRVSTVEVSGTYKTDYLVGEALDLTGAVVTVTLADGTSKTVDWRELTVSGYDPNTPGEQVVTLTYNGPKNSASTTITVKVTPKSSKITVTVSILGDSAHGEGGAVHTLSGGGLQTWAAATQYDADTAWTVWDVLQKAFTANNITPQTSAKMGTVYIEALTRGGVTLAEFDNGPNSGWMYTINGHHSLLGVSQQYLHDKDNIVLHYSDDYTLEEGSSDFEDADDAVKKVEDLIDAIGDNVTLDSKDKIEAARKAYNALTYAQKQQVSNYGKLQAAEARLRELRAEADKTAAKAVEDQIDALPSPAGEADREAVAAARKAYDALTDAQKKLVKNYQKLVEAQRDIALLDATPEDIEAADAVQKLIDALPEPVKTEDKAAVEAARKAYDALTDLQKLLVTNLTKLEAAEERLKLLDALKPSLDIYAAAGEFIESLRDLTEEADLYALGMARSGHEVSGKYYEAVEDYVAEYIDESGRLHRSRSEDNSRTILVLTALGRDVTDVGGHNLLLGLSDMEYLKKQGVTGPAWALIALDSHDYEIPENPEAEEQASREKIVEYLMEEANEDGGWSISGKLSEAETTAVVLTALAGYYPEDEETGEALDEAAEKLKAVVDKGVQTLSDMQDEDGGYSALAKDGTTMEPNSESAAAVLTALSALNIDGHTDQRFVKNGKSVIDALCEYSVEGGGFSEKKEGERSEGATEVAYTALTAYLRMLEGETALYDMSDVEIEAPAAEAKPLTALTEPEPTEAAPEVPEATQPPETPEEEKPSLWDRIVGWFR